MNYSQALSTPGPNTPPAASLRGVGLGLALAFSWVLFYVFSDQPRAAIFISDLAFSLFLTSLFQNKYRFIFLLHAPITFFCSQFFITPFIDLGDGGAYEAVVAEYFNRAEFRYIPGNYLETFDIFGFLKYASLGILPIYSIPEYFFYNPDSTVYYLWQGTFHIILSAVVISLARSWCVIKTEHLLSVALFAVMSPSFYDLGAAPTRHLVTFFGVFLLFFSYMALLKKFTIVRAVSFAVAVATVLISKHTLFIPAIIFVVIDLAITRKASPKALGFLAILAGATSFILPDLIETTMGYDQTALGGAATFGGLVQLPIVGWIVKYVYALLAPFPWSQAHLFVDSIYGGNSPLFIMHILSSIVGLHMFTAMIAKYKIIFASDVALKTMIMYGLLMSLSILRGATGFHTYLLIYFPFFAPLLVNREFRVNPLLSVGFILTLEFALLLQKF